MKNLFIIIFIVLSSIAFSQTCIIANKSVSESSLDKRKVTSIFQLKTTSWGDGSNIVIFDAKDGLAKDAFYDYIGSKQAKLKKIWLKLKLTKGTATPNAVGSSEVVSKVGSTPGAIGYCNKSDVTGDVKVLAEF